MQYTPGIYLTPSMLPAMTPAPAHQQPAYLSYAGLPTSFIHLPTFINSCYAPRHTLVQAQDASLHSQTIPGLGHVHTVSQHSDSTQGHSYKSEETSPPSACAFQDSKHWNLPTPGPATPIAMEIAAKATNTHSNHATSATTTEASPQVPEISYSAPTPADVSPTNSETTQHSRPACSLSPPPPLHQLRLPTIGSLSHAAADLMEEETDAGYFSFSDLSPLPASTDLQNNAAVKSDSSFSDILDDMLDSLGPWNTPPTSPARGLGLEQPLGQDTKPGISIHDNTPAISDHSNRPATSMHDNKHFISVHGNTPAFSDHSNRQVTSIHDNKQEISVLGSQHYFTSPSVHSNPIMIQPGFCCVVCNKYFQTKTDFNIHIRMHAGRRPHQCPFCEKAFTQKSILKTHIRTHTGERPYKCEQCPQAFADYSTYRKHLRVHTGEKPYICDICGKGFTQSGNMIRHKKVHLKAAQQDIPNFSVVLA